MRAHAFPASHRVQVRSTSFNTTSISQAFTPSTHIRSAVHSLSLLPESQHFLVRKLAVILNSEAMRSRERIEPREESLAAARPAQRDHSLLSIVLPHLL
jgi:hypothetical protein